MKPSHFFGMVFIAILFGLNARALADAKVEEQVVAAATNGNTCVLSPRGAHLACVTRKGSRVVVTVDGVAGPKFDQLTTVAGGGITNGYTSREERTRVITFSIDGDHYAYCGQQGNEMVVVLDGKEFQRTPFTLAMFNGCPLQFSPGGKHLFYAYNDKGNDLFIMDGKACPSMPTMLPPNYRQGLVFSADDSRYAYLTGSQEQPNAQTLVVDGKNMGAVGVDPQFTPDSKFVVTVLRQPGGAAMMINGQPVAKTPGIQKIYVSPHGKNIIPVMIHPNPQGPGTMVLVVNGKPVDASASPVIDNVVFSPDGKRYAAHCRSISPEQEWVILDGKKGDLYKHVEPADMIFSPDSSKMAYVAQANGTYVVVVNGEESDGFDILDDKPVFSPTGSHLAYVTSQSNDPNTTLVVDGKTIKRRGGNHPVFSTDGSRCAFTYGTPGNARSLVIDGADQKGVIVSNYAFSADGKHLEYLGQREQDPQFGLFVDNTLVYARPGVFSQTFTPDGQHLFWSGVEQPDANGGGQLVLYCDGKVITKFDNTMPTFHRVAEAWEMGSDGVLTVVGHQGDSIKRLRVTPSADTSIATMLASAGKAAK